MRYFLTGMLSTWGLGLAILVGFCQYASMSGQATVVVSKPSPLMLQLRDGCFYRQDNASGKELVRETSLSCLSERELKSITKADVSLGTATKIHEARQLYTDRVELFELMK